MTGRNILLKKKAKAKTIINPYFSSTSCRGRSLVGKTEKRILEPSRGGTGTKLKTARTILIRTTSLMTIKKELGRSVISSETRIITANIKAIHRFEKGPAKATIASPHLLFFKLYGLYGTGLAHPKIKPEKLVRIGTMTEPTGSMCLMGFKVSLPSYFAVRSPRKSAA